MATAIITAAVLSLKATPPSSFTPSPQPAATAYQSPFAPDSLSLLFPSPVLRVNLEEVLPSGTFDALEEAILASWDDHLAEQATLAETGTRRATTEGERLRAASNQELNEEFFYYQRSEYGVSGQQSEPKGWLASEAAQELLDVITAVTAGYITRIAHHAGMDVGRPEDLEEDEEWELPLDPDKLHVWASVHHGESQHPRHVHMGAAVSGVFYLRVPPGAGRLCFFDPRGCIPPFEREVRHAPQRGEMLLFPPWLSHAVGCSGAADDGPRLSISFNYVDEELEGGRYGWGEATAGLDPKAVHDLLDTLTALSRAGTAVVLATHDVDVAWTWSQDTLILSEHTVRRGPTHELLCDDALLADARLATPWGAAVSRRLNRTVLRPSDI